MSEFVYGEVMGRGQYWLEERSTDPNALGEVHVICDERDIERITALLNERDYADRHHIGEILAERDRQDEQFGDVLKSFHQRLDGIEDCLGPITDDTPSVVALRRDSLIKIAAFALAAVRALDFLKEGDG